MEGAGLLEPSEDYFFVLVSESQATNGGEVSGYLGPLLGPGRMYSAMSKDIERTINILNGNISCLSQDETQ